MNREHILIIKGAIRILKTYDNTQKAVESLENIVLSWEASLSDFERNMEYYHLDKDTRTVTRSEYGVGKWRINGNVLEHEFRRRDWCHCCELSKKDFKNIEKIILDRHVFNMNYYC